MYFNQIPIQYYLIIILEYYVTFQLDCNSTIFRVESIDTIKRMYSLKKKILELNLVLIQIKLWSLQEIISHLHYSNK